jgi:phosphoribosylformylglycinamidine cyclo-ligase
MKTGGSFVDRKAQGEFVSTLIRQFKYKRGDFKTIGSFGGFTSLVDLGTFAISFNTDNVGTKTMIAEEANKYDTIGIDCIAMCVNDAITSGSEPLAMVDYIQLKTVDTEVARQIGTGLNVGAQMANLTMVGGETAIVPDLVSHIDLSGTSIGIVQKGQIVNGERIEDGDLLFSLGSSGIHSNGFTTVRSVLAKNEIGIDDKFPGDSKRVSEVLLEPTRIYVREILDLLNIVNLKGLVNITGGGVRNISRVKDMRYVIDNPVEPQNVFKKIMELGNFDYPFMYETFNMGTGFVVVTDEDSKRDLLSTLKGKVPVREIGHVENGSGIDLPEFGVTFKDYY